VWQLEQVALFGGHLRQTLQRHPHLGDASQGRRLLYETIRQMLSAQVYDIIDRQPARDHTGGAGQRAGGAPGAAAGLLLAMPWRRSRPNSSSSCCATCTAMPR
jgi:hypothetical protein